MTFKNAPSLETFKALLKKSYFSSPVVLPYFISGKRVPSVYHCRLRNGCSSLNHDLYQNHLRTKPNCDCGNELEDAEHFFFQCIRFTEQHKVLFYDTRKFHPLSVCILLFGHDDFPANDNEELFTYVHKFILGTNCF